MQNLWTVFGFELREQLTRRAYLLTTFGIPLVAAIVLGAYLGYQELQSNDSADETESTETEFENADPVGYVDLSGMFPAPDTDSPFAALVIPFDSAAAGEDALEAEDIDQLFVIEADYMESGAVTQILPNFNFEALESNLMESFILSSLAAGTSPELAIRLRYPLLQLQAQTITPGGETTDAQNDDTQFVVVYAFAMLLMLSTIFSSSYLLQTVVKERETSAIEIILTSVKPFPLLAGKILALGLSGMFQILVWITAAVILVTIAADQILDFANVEVTPQTVIIALVYFVLGFLFAGGIFASVGALTNNSREGSQMAGFIVIPMVIPLMFIAVFVEQPDSTLPIALSMIPFTAPVAMVMRSVAGEIELWQLVVSLVLMVVTAIGSMWMAGRMFRVSSLLSGSMPRLRDIPKLLLQG